MQDRMALCFHRFSWVNHRLIAFLFLLCFLENIHSQTFGCTFWVQRSRSILGILGLEQWLGRQCCLGWPVENSGKLTLSLVIKNRIQMASRGAEGNNDRHQQAFVRKNRRGGWHEALQMYPGTPGEKLINLFLFWKGSKEMDTGQLFLKIDTLCFPMEFWKPMCSVDLACKYDDEWFEKWKTCLHRECIGV